jgi:hypothetical protein
VTLRVIDDGIGFAVEAPNMMGTGLRIMRYRADLIGAHLEISAARPHGTIVSCSVAPRAETACGADGENDRRTAPALCDVPDEEPVNMQERIPNIEQSTSNVD